MQEVFYEETATIQNQEKAAKKYNFFKLISRICYILFTLYAIILFLFFGPDPNGAIFSIIFSFLPLVIFLVTAILCGRYKNTLYVEYDYTFISGSIRIAKVVKDYRRKTVINFDTYNIEKIGRYNSSTYNKYQIMPGINKLILTQNLIASENKDFYYLVVNVNSKKNLLVLECSDQFIVNILKFSKKTILEERFFN
ncbi:MAG: hypothetical protein E7372_00485 [Clostridiales bacterium]|nr:hypothetical protein [Clostridiales bacterium]